MDLACAYTGRPQQAPQGCPDDTCPHMFLTGSSTVTFTGAQECKNGGERASRGKSAETLWV